MTSADFDLPGPVVLERGDVARLVGAASCDAARLELVLHCAQIGAITKDFARELLADVEPARPGLIPCSTCGTEQTPRDGRMAVHFAARADLRPCAGSWPAKVAAKGRAA